VIPTVVAWRATGSLPGGDNGAMPASGLPVWYPPPPTGDVEVERRLATGGVLEDVRCPVCGYRGPIGGFTDNLRESGYCPTCGAWTRIRQMAAALVEVGPALTGRPVTTVAELAGVPGLRIYNTEAHGSLDAVLGGAPGYVASEYFGPDLTSGDWGPDGVLHEDLQELSFEPDSFDLVLSTDVLEHVADPYRAHAEIHRVLRPDGHHVFTVPFVEHALLDDVRAVTTPEGVVQHLAEPIYHIDPVRIDEGALVFTLFGLEMLTKLAHMGMDTTVYRPADLGRGLVGGGAVFDAVKRR
jgi:SAM-dependent methyltransferase